MYVSRVRANTVCWSSKDDRIIMICFWPSTTFQSGPSTTLQTHTGGSGAEPPTVGDNHKLICLYILRVGAALRTSSPFWYQHKPYRCECGTFVVKAMFSPFPATWPVCNDDHTLHDS